MNMKVGLTQYVKPQTLNAVQKCDFKDKNGIIHNYSTLSDQNSKKDFIVI